MKEFTPREIVKELDKYIVGQEKAKRAVAIALRNRWRRQQLSEELREEVMPNNIIMIGPTGVGKTEIARRLAFLANAPFIKVEASKFTEVGYVGRDVESMVRDLVDLAAAQVRKEMSQGVQEKANQQAEERILDVLLPPRPSPVMEPEVAAGDGDATREKLRVQLREGKLAKRQVEVEIPVHAFPMVEVFTPMGMEELGVNFQEMISGMMPKKTKRRKMSVEEAQRVLTQEEAGKLVDMDEVIGGAIYRVENSGIVFLDEIDKITGEKVKTGPDVSREGVQRDLLPIVEGSNVMTKYGMVKTDHILFIAAGAFHTAKPSDLIPELQGRFPIRVELDSLTTEDFVRILTEPKNALVKQYTELLATEGIEVSFSEDGIFAIAQTASLVNERTENIGARRLHTVMTALLDEYLFRAPDPKLKRLKITADVVDKTLKKVVEDEDLSRYIL